MVLTLPSLMNTCKKTNKEGWLSGYMHLTAAPTPLPIPMEDVKGVLNEYSGLVAQQDKNRGERN
jgi:hypothetical protein